MASHREKTVDRREYFEPLPKGSLREKSAKGTKKIKNYLATEGAEVTEKKRVLVSGVLGLRLLQKRAFTEL